MTTNHDITEHDFVAYDALPIHYRDDEHRGLCSRSGGERTPLGGCPNGCSGATVHYSNDGHRGCYDPPVIPKRRADSTAH